MSKKKPFRLKGKLSLSKYFQDFKENDKVAVVIEPSVKFSFPKRLQGRTGFISGVRGKSYLVKINDQTLEKTFLIAPIHLKKLK